MGQQRRPIYRAGGAFREIPVGDKPVGSWAKTITVPVGGVFSQDIPAGIFAALPVIRHTIQSAGTRDYILRLTGVTLNPTTKVVTVAGVVRESRLLPASLLTLVALQGYDTFQATTTAVTLHLSAEEGD